MSIEIFVKNDFHLRYLYHKNRFYTDRISQHNTTAADQIDYQQTEQLITTQKSSSSPVDVVTVSSRIPHTNKMEEIVRKAVLDGCPKNVDSDTADYLADVAAGLLEDFAEHAEAFRENLEDVFMPLLEETMKKEEVLVFCEAVCRAGFPAGANAGAVGAKGEGALHHQHNTDPNLLCRLPNLLMMYGGSEKPLLRNALLELHKGRVYGVVGANGTGKTTLMDRIAARDIMGFCPGLQTVHVSASKLLQDCGNASKTVREYIQTGDADVARAFADVGFGEDTLDSELCVLSGGWQMRFILAKAVSQKASLWIFDEPTNHLDAAGSQWLVDFCTRTFLSDGLNSLDAGAAALIVSHDADFLDAVCTDIILFTAEGALEYHPGNFSAFKKNVLHDDLVETDRVLGKTSRAAGDSRTSEEMRFPNPDQLISSSSAGRKAPVLTLQKASYGYNGNGESGCESTESGTVLNDVNVKLAMESKVAIVGANGSGKSTLLALMAGRLKPKKGELWWHERLRLSYVAQSHLTHLGESLEKTPVEYVQSRFLFGYDSTVPEKKARVLTPKEEADRKRLGMQFGKKSKPVLAVLQKKEQVVTGTQTRETLYYVDWEGSIESDRSWENRGKLNKCGASSLVEDLDLRLWQAWAGGEPRSTAEKDVIKHLRSFGLPPEICARKISTLSSGQKVKLMFAAAFWVRPHILCLDEPTNFLDMESVGILEAALKEFRGGFCVVTHNEGFAQAVCDETWVVSGKNVHGAKKIYGNAKLQ